MMTWLAFVCGILLHTIFKWAAWKRGRLARGWMEFWVERGPHNIMAACAALASAFVWEQGWLPWVINSMVAGVFGHDFEPLRVTALSSLFAGYFLDSIGRHLLTLLERGVPGDPE